MLKYIQIAIGVIITSFYFFPFEFTFLPGVNTKMAMAGIGLVVLGFQLGKAKNSLLNKDLMLLSGYALLVSLIGFISVTYNETRDYSYATYIVSMWVWLSAAYVAVMYMRKVHGYVSVELVCNYLIAVCVFQCVSALLIQYVPLFKSVVNEYIGTMSGMLRGTASALNDRGRLYAIGAALDISGSRFASVLYLIGYLCVKNKNTMPHSHQWLYTISFFIICVIGNMIARTTIVGVFVVIAYFTFDVLWHKCLHVDVSYFRPFLIVGVCSTILINYLYTHNGMFYDNVRFAFEGFFYLYEQGVWNTNSTNILENMYRLPETTKTWLIGDGYFDNPTTDPYYVGHMWKGFYMGTDVGYLRFVFYFGLSGLCAFIGFICKATHLCIKRQKSCVGLFMGIFVLNFLVWLKVSTDLFLIMALFIASLYLNDASSPNVSCAEKEHITE